MNLLYCGDKKMEDGFMMSVISIARQSQEPIEVYILTMEWEKDGKIYEEFSVNCADKAERYLKTINRNSFVKRILLPDVLKKQLEGENVKTRFTPYCMLRLFADLLKELPDKILYLDADVICRKNPNELYSIDVEEYEVAGVLDYYGSWFFRTRWYRRDYINSGVLLLNLKRIRENGLFMECRNLCKNKKMFMPDQSAINKLAQSKKVLPRKFNEQRRLKKSTCFQHFTTSFRFFPWLHTITVKPWENEKMHRILGLYEYDEIYELMVSLRGKERKAV